MNGTFAWVFGRADLGGNTWEARKAKKVAKATYSAFGRAQSISA